jgi:membrane protease subunit (stomatin/prohibitin family)
MLVQVIEWREDTGRELVHRFEPGGEITMGAQLTVTENQWAVFFRDGKALDAFEAGRYTLHTRNLPLLVEVVKLPFGGKTPFRADVYFVARKTFTDLRWGTREPVLFRDPQFDMVRLRAHGRFAVRVSEPRQVVNTLVGTLGRYSTEDIEDYLRSIVVARLNDVLGEAAIPLLDLPRMYDELADQLCERVADDFGGYGLELEKLVIGAITPPEEVARVIDERSGMAAVGMAGSYTGFKAARALGDAAAGGGGGTGDGAASQGMGLGVGAGLGMAIPGMMREAFGQGGAATAAPAAPATQAGATFCTGCGGKLPPSARFCPQCGQQAAVDAAACGRCGREVPEGARFCPGCGTQQG